MSSRDPSRFSNSQAGEVINVSENLGSKGLPGEKGEKGDPGEKGDTGERGLPGVSGQPYEFVQSVAASLWIVNHNLGKYPGVTVIDSSGRKVRGSVNYPTSNQILLTFSAPFAGKAYLN